MLSVMLEVAIGLGLVYLLASILCSGLRELLARAMKERGRLLREGLVRLVPDRWIYLRMLNHPLVGGLYRASPGSGAPPSYLPEDNFARALLDVLLSRGGDAPALTLENLQTAVRQARDQDLAVGHALLPVVGGAANLEAAVKGVEDWYRNAMDRVSGWYKARTQKLLFVLGFLLTVALNLDSLQIAGTLTGSPELRAASVAAAERLTAKSQEETDAKAAREELTRLGRAGLPIGYACLGTRGSAEAPAGSPRDLVGLAIGCAEAAGALGAGDWLMKLVGWLITAMAISLGSPFWFDLLGRMVNMRQSGGRPEKAKA